MKKHRSKYSLFIEYSHFEFPPARDGVIIGKMAPVGMKSLEKAMNAILPGTFVTKSIEHNVIEGIIIRKSDLRKIPEKNLMDFILKYAVPIMDETDILRFNLDIVVKVSEDLEL